MWDTVGFPGTPFPSSGVKHKALSSGLRDGKDSAISVCVWDTVGIPGTPSLSSRLRCGKDRGIFSLCVGPSGNSRDSLSVLGTKGWEGQSNFSLCVGHSGNPRNSLSIQRDGKDRGISICEWDTVGSGIPGTTALSLGLRDGKEKGIFVCV